MQGRSAQLVFGCEHTAMKENTCGHQSHVQKHSTSTGASRRNATEYSRRAPRVPKARGQRIQFSDVEVCNVFRAADRVSQDLIRTVCYPGRETPVDDLAFQVVAYRTFSNTATWAQLTLDLGHVPVLEDLRSGALETALTDMRDRKQRIYTGALILCATALMVVFEHLNHIELFKDMFLRSQLAERIVNAPSLSAVYDLLHAFPLMGDFMSYQIAIDSN